VDGGGLDRLDPADPRRPQRSDPGRWHEDIGHPGFERLWSGEMWTEEIRRVGETGLPVAGVAEPEGPATWEARPGVPPTGVPVMPTATAGVPAAGAFESPPVLGQPPRSVPRRGANYRDDSPPDKLGTLGAFVQIALGVVIATEVAQLVANQIYIGVQSDLLAGRLPNIGHIESVIDAVHTTDSLSLIASGITAILFLVWFYRAYRNLVRSGIQDLRYAPGWAVGSWFIPFFNFVRPKADRQRHLEGVGERGDRRPGAPRPAQPARPGQLVVGSLDPRRRVRGDRQRRHLQRRRPDALHVVVAAPRTDRRLV
jgi:hypothetical protein